jgi:hypothetical protein
VLLTIGFGLVTAVNIADGRWVAAAVSGLFLVTGVVLYIVRPPQPGSSRWLSKHPAAGALAGIAVGTAIGIATAVLTSA